MGFLLSKPNNPLIQENFDGQSSDYTVSADKYSTPFGPEWIFSTSHLDQVKEELIDLDKLSNVDVPMFSLENHIVAAKCVKVYDGDTLHLALKYNGEMIKYRFRMIGYNSPEIYGGDEEENKKGILARNYLADRLLGKKVLARLDKVDKYGRPLCDLYLIEDEENLTIDNAFTIHINKEMIDKGYGEPYLE